ncbi:MAG: malate:quinone oxidoreductase, partial [Hymenobacter sp.]
ILKDPSSFIRNIPHLSFVWGEKNVEYLKTRYTNLKSCNLFNEMQYSENPAEINEWVPLIMEGRDEKEPIAATKVDLGTDVNFGSLTREMFSYLAKQDKVALHFHHEIRDLNKQDDGSWEVKVKNLDSGNRKKRLAKFVFIGAGGGSLLLLEKAICVKC